MRSRTGAIFCQFDILVASGKVLATQSWVLRESPLPSRSPDHSIHALNIMLSTCANAFGNTLDKARCHERPSCLGELRVVVVAVVLLAEDVGVARVVVTGEHKDEISNSPISARFKTLMSWSIIRGTAAGYITRAAPFSSVIGARMTSCARLVGKPTCFSAGSHAV